jgi:hypothetical protein
MPGPKSGVGARHALFPIRTTLGASLSRAVCFPTPLIAACDAIGLIAGPSRSFQAGIFRVRSLSPVRIHLPMVNSPDRCWHACNVCVSHQHLATGTAPAFGRAFAPCNGSDLLPLRLLSTCSWVTRFSRRPKEEVLRALPDSPAPRCAGSLSRPAWWGWAFWWGGPTGTLRCVLVYSSNRNPLGNCINSRPETGPESDSARTRFLSSRLAAQLLCRITGSAATPSRGTGDICLHAARAAEGRATPIIARLSPVARDYPSRALGGFFMPPALRLFYQGTWRN